MNIKRTLRPGQDAATVHKLCRKCGLHKPLTEFPRRFSNGSNRTPREVTFGSKCRECKRAHDRQRWKQHRKPVGGETWDKPIPGMLEAIERE